MPMGLPQVVTSDQGGEFVNNLNKQLMERLGITQQPITTGFFVMCFLYYN